ERGRATRRRRRLSLGHAGGERAWLFSVRVGVVVGERAAGDQPRGAGDPAGRVHGAVYHVLDLHLRDARFRAGGALAAGDWPCPAANGRWYGQPFYRNDSGAAVLAGLRGGALRGTIVPGEPCFWTGSGAIGRVNHSRRK